MIVSADELRDYASNDRKDSLMADREDLENRFTYHKPIGSQPPRYEAIRRMALEFAGLVDRYAPESREKSLAFTKIEEAVMWANAAIARNEHE